MRAITILLSFSLLALTATTAFASTANPVLNGGFELHAPFGAAALKDTPLDGPGIGVGRQALGCTSTATLVWEEDCRGAARDRATEAQALAADPQGEVDAWTQPGAQRGDLAIIAPADQGIWYAAAWSQHPTNTIAYGDRDGDGDREAAILPGNQMLYQSFASGSPHTALPAGTIRAVTASFEAGAPAGSFVFVLDSFPLESAVDWPQAFINYQLYMPASTWSFVDGVATIDPLLGTLSGPAAGGWILPDVDEHPTAAQWNGASREERQAMLMEFRVIQMTFWNLKAGTVLDDVAFDVVG